MMERRRAWSQRALLGLSAVAAYQFGFHICVLSTIPPGSDFGGFAFASVLLGTPVAIGWAAVAVACSRAIDRGGVATRVLLGAAVYALGVMIVFAAFTTHTHGWDAARFWLDLISFITVLGAVGLPLAVFVTAGNGLANLLSLIAIGLPTVGPILLLIAWSGWQSSLRDGPS